MAKKRDYSVGYGKPPVGTRFKKGESGNSRGRPRGSKNKVTPYSFSKMLQEEGSRFIEVREKGKIRKMNTNRAIMRATLIAAANGDIKAQKLALDIMAKDENRRAADNADRLKAAHDYKQWWAGESKRRKLHGEPDPNFRFHPDKLHIDYANGTVTYLGLTPDQETYVDMIDRVKGTRQWAALEILKEGPPKEPGFLEFTWEDLKHCVETIAKFDASVGMPWPTDCPDCPDFNELDEVEERVMKELGLKAKTKAKAK